MSRRIVIGTRGSELALVQARWVQAALGGEARSVVLEIVRTLGDERLDLNLSESLDKGLFTSELETALAERRVDLAVHSLKDLPTQVPDGLVLGAVPARATAADVLLARPDVLTADAGGLGLAPGTLVGTSSPRRAALLALAAPAASVPAVFRGNVPTRLARCEDGSVGALVLARAGLARLGAQPGRLVAFDLDVATWLPAPGQGALGLQVRESDADLLRRLAPLDCPDTRGAVLAEREVLARLGLGCHAALGALGSRSAAGWMLRAGRLGPQGTWQAVTVTAERAADLGALAVAALEACDDAPSAVPTARPAEPWW